METDNFIDPLESESKPIKTAEEEAAELSSLVSSCEKDL